MVAEVGSRAVTRSDLNGYLEQALGGPVEAVAAAPEVKSRLLDQLLDEELLLAEAAARGVTVSDDEVKEQLPGQASEMERNRRVLLLRKLKKEIILAGVSVSPEEVQKHFDENIAELRRPAVAVLRKVLLDTVEEARAVREELEKRPAEFEEIAATRSLAPDGGQPQAYEEEILPESLRQAVAGLKEGELSQVVEDPQGFFILKLESRQPERAPVLEEIRGEIELKLLQDRSQQRYREYVDALRRRTSVEIFPDQLGFSYRPRTEAS